MLRFCSASLRTSGNAVEAFSTLKTPLRAGRPDPRTPLPCCRACSNKHTHMHTHTHTYTHHSSSSIRESANFYITSTDFHLVILFFCLLIFFKIIVVLLFFLSAYVYVAVSFVLDLIEYLVRRIISLIFNC